MNTNAVTIIDTEHPDKPHPVLLDDPDAGAANPWGVLFSADGSRLLVTHAGTHELSVIDFPALLERMKREDRGGESVSERLGFLHDLRTRIPLPLNGPRALAADGEKVYVAGFFSDTLAEVPLRQEGAARSIPLNEGVQPSREQLGEKYFNDASHCFQGWQSCATCHPDARVDGLNWDLLNDGMGNPKNTRTMFLSHRTSPVMTLGVRASAEVAVKSGFVHIQFMEPSGELVECVNEYVPDGACPFQAADAGNVLRAVPCPRRGAGRVVGLRQTGEGSVPERGMRAVPSPPVFHDEGTDRHGNRQGAG